MFKSVKLHSTDGSDSAGFLGPETSITAGGRCDLAGHSSWLYNVLVEFTSRVHFFSGEECFAQFLFC